MPTGKLGKWGPGGAACVAPPIPVNKFPRGHALTHLVEYLRLRPGQRLREGDEGSQHDEDEAPFL